MPALNPPLEAAFPRQARRRTWSAPELTSHALLVLTPDRLHLAPAGAGPRPEAVAAVEAGADPEGVLGPPALVVELTAVRRLALDLLTNALVIEYGATGRLRVTFATPEAADACFTRVWRRLGDDYRLTPYGRDTAALVRGPLALLALSLLVTAAVVMLLNLAADRDFAPAGAAPAEHVLETIGGWLSWLDWRVACALGGAAAAVSQVWLYRRLTTPPVSLEVVRG